MTGKSTSSPSVQPSPPLTKEKSAKTSIESLEGISYGENAISVLDPNGTLQSHVTKEIQINPATPDNDNLRY